MNLLKFIPGFALLFFVIAIPSGFASFDEELPSLTTLSKRILAQFPPSDYAYIAIGRSPSALIAYFQTEKSKEINASTIPLSDFRYGTYERPLEIEEEKRLFSHFDQYITLKSHLPGKRILVMDYSSNGSSLGAAVIYLQKFLEVRQLNYKLAALTLFPQAAGENHIRGNFKKWITPDLPVYFYSLENSDPLTKATMSSSYDALAEYKSFKISKLKGVRINPNYQTLLETIRVYKSLGDDSEASLRLPQLISTLELLRKTRVLKIEAKKVQTRELSEKISSLYEQCRLVLSQSGRQLVAPEKLGELLPHTTFAEIKQAVVEFETLLTQLRDGVPVQSRLISE